MTDNNRRAPRICSPRVLIKSALLFALILLTFTSPAPAAVLIPLGDLPGGIFSSSAFGVSADGSVVVGFGNSDSGPEAFRWAAASDLVGLGDLPGGSFSSFATGVSADGSVVVGSGSTVVDGDPAAEAFRWTQGGGMVGLGDLAGGGFQSEAHGVSADGAVVVGFGRSALGFEAFRWTAASGMVGLGDLPGGTSLSRANAVSDDGSVVVGRSDGTAGNEAFIWTSSSGMRRLEDVLGEFSVSIEGFSRLQDATGVSSNGRTIVGNGIRSGNQEAWVIDFRSLDFTWTSASSGSWSDAENWTGGVFTPSVGDDAIIDPNIGLTVSGPETATTVQSLTVGALAGGIATLEIQPTGNITVTGQTTIGERGRLTGDGTLSAEGGINNQGEIDLGIASLQISGGTLSNSGLIRGNGLINAPLANTADGQVRAENGRRIRFTGVGNANSGDIDLLGGIVEFDQDLSNSSTGFIAGRGALITGTSLTNNGTMAFSGTADILGDVSNESSGLIVNSSGATLTFFDDLEHNGAEVRTSADSRTVIFGTASGAGPYTGTGSVFFEGDLQPGNSAAVVSFAGDLNLGIPATTEIELGGLLTGEFDRLKIAGDAALAGELFVELLVGFTPTPGDTFKIFDIAGTQSGQFNGLAEGALIDLGAGTMFNITYAGGDGNDIVLTTIPEPTSLAIFALALATVSCASPRRRHARK